MPNAFLSGLTQGLGSSLSTVFEEREAQRRQSAIEERQKRLDERQQKIDAQTSTIAHLRFLQDIKEWKDPAAREYAIKEYAKGIGLDPESPEYADLMKLLKNQNATNEVVSQLLAQRPGVGKERVEEFVGEDPARAQLPIETLESGLDSSIRAEGRGVADTIRQSAVGGDERAVLQAEVNAAQAELGFVERNLGETQGDLRTSLRDKMDRLQAFDTAQAEAAEKAAEPEDFETLTMYPPPGLEVGGELALQRDVEEGSDLHRELMLQGYTRDKPDGTPDPGKWMSLYSPDGVTHETIRANSQRAAFLAGQGWTTTRRPRTAWQILLADAGVEEGSEEYHMLSNQKIARMLSEKGIRIEIDPITNAITSIEQGALSDERRISADQEARLLGSYNTAQRVVTGATRIKKILMDRPSRGGIIGQIRNFLQIGFGNIQDLGAVIDIDTDRYIAGLRRSVSIDTKVGVTAPGVESFLFDAELAALPLLVRYLAYDIMRTEKIGTSSRSAAITSGDIEVASKELITVLTGADVKTALARLDENIFRGREKMSSVVASMSLMGVLPTGTADAYGYEGIADLEGNITWGE